GFYPTHDAAYAASLMEQSELDPRARARDLSRGMLAKLCLLLALGQRTDPAAGLGTPPGAAGSGTPPGAVGFATPATEGPALSRILDTVPAMLVATDREGRCVYANPLWQQMVGAEACLRDSLTWLDGVSADDRERARDAWKTLLDGDGVLALELRLQAAGQPVTWADVRVARYEGDGADARHYLGFAADITRRKEAEDALREREEFLSAVFENIPLMVFVKDAAELRFVRFNRASEAQLGITREEMYGKNDYDFFEPSQAAFFTAKDREVLNNKTLIDIPEEPIQTRDRGQRLLHTKKIPILDSHGEPRYLLGISEDITEQKLAEAELRRAKDAADTANRAKSAFLANMSHEIRTPLHAMLGFAQILRNEPALASSHQQILDHMLSSGEHLLSLINDVLEMSKIEAGRQILQPLTFDLHQLILQYGAIFRARVQTPGVTFHIETAPDLPRWVSTDRDHLSRALLNVLGNAVKFTSSGHVTLRARAVASTADTAELLLEVEDTGIGIAPEDLRRVFEPFEQDELGRRYGGTGLGLALTRQYAELLGGQVDVESTPGTGSTFRLRIPVRIVSEPMGVKPAQRPDRVIGLASGQPRWRILVTDDQQANREVLRALLGPVGFEVELSESAEETFELLNRWRPQLIFMDIRMPGVDGLAAIRRLKADPATHDLPVVAVTAGAFAEDRAAALDAGADAFLRKPFRREEMLDLIANLVPVQYLRAGTRPGPEGT
ncbi:MAG: PAS domain-containing protein, partial [Candidatus Riflebacteria bacterium]|nr:PAS domain-containing protein [Candidatus Riflebacteria bacterium]